MEGGGVLDPEQTEFEGLVREKSVWDWLPTLLAYLAVYALLLGFFRPDLLFSLSTTSGGDTGAHHYPAQYLIEELLPNFKLTGWAPGWYAGMPMLTFYFPFPFLLIALLDYILPYAVAFKIGTILGVFALPVTAYALGRLWRVRRPFPTMAALFAAAFLFMESYSIYGANILSTLAGEFGYMLSFALVFLFLGTMYRGMEKPGLNMLFVLNCVILLAIVLSHIVTTVVLVCIVPGLLLAHPRWRSLVYLLAVAVVGFCLSAFWSLPFAANLEWTAHMAWNQLGFKEIWSTLTGELLIILILAVVGVLYGACNAIRNRERRLLPLLWITVITLVLFAVLPNGRLWNARVLPFFYVSLHLWAAYGVAWLVRPFMVMVWDLFRLRAKPAGRAYIPLIAVVAVAAVALSTHTAGGWIRWNYSGYEGKPAWSEYKQINDYIATLSPHSRVMIEHGDKLDEFGTPRAFEIIPYWTDADTMEGTLMEASYTAAFHFINQRELSEQPSNAIIGVDYPSDIDVTRGITHLQLMNIPYFLAFYNEDGNERVIPAVEADSRAELLASFGDYRLYRISGCSGYVEVMDNEPVRVAVDQSEWRDMAVEWYLNEDALHTPLVWDNGEEALQQFASITPDQAAYPPEVPVKAKGRVVGEMIENDRLSFDVDANAVGKPVWVKISYFPNWHVEGAEGPFLASPSMMMVIPTQAHVELYYGRTAVNTVGQVLEAVAWALLVGLTVWRVVLWRRRRLETVPAEASDLMPPDDRWAADDPGRDEPADSGADYAGPGEDTGTPDSQGTPV